MKLLLVFVACLVALPSAYGFLELVQPHGRGFTQVDNQRAPCGQSPIEIAGPRADWYAGKWNKSVGLSGLDIHNHITREVKTVPHNDPYHCYQNR